MGTTTITMQVANNDNIITESNKCPLPLAVIPNYMGINLCSVKDISWTVREDGQLEKLTIDFIPTEGGND